MESGQKKHVKRGEQGNAESLEGTNPSANRWSVLASMILIVLLGVTVYGNSLNGQFIWDDKVLVKDNLTITEWSHLPQIFRKETGAGAGARYNFYRPMQMLTYMLDYHLWKLDQRGYHLTNILLHICAALALYWLVTIFYHHQILSLLTGILFVSHPIHTEAVTYISGRADSLALLFMLLCFIFYIKHLQAKGIGTFGLMIATYLCALLSRENSFILPPLLLLYHYSFKVKLKIGPFLSVTCVAFIYLVWRFIHFNPDLSHQTLLLQRIPGIFVALADYIRLLLLPFNLHMEYGARLFAFTDVRAMIGILLFSIIILYAFRQKDRNPFIFFSISWFFIALVPQSNLFPLSAYMAEHWLYVPSIGFFLILARGLNYFLTRDGKKIIGGVLIVGLVGFYSCLTVKQNILWREPISYYQKLLEHVTDSPRVYNNLGLAYSEMGKESKAQALYQKAIKVDSTYFDAHYNLGNTYKALGKEEEAVASYKKTVGLSPKYTKAYYNMGITYAQMGRKEEAILSYEEAIKLEPENAILYNNLGTVYSAMNHADKALAYYKEAVKINPNYEKAYNNLGNAYMVLRKKEEAITSYKKAIELNPTFAAAYYNMGNAYLKIGRKKDAIHSYKKALEVNPNDVRARDQLMRIFPAGE